MSKRHPTSRLIAFPQWLRVDLGSPVSVNKVVLKLPAANWGTRSQTLAVQGSTNGTNFPTSSRRRPTPSPGRRR